MSTGVDFVIGGKDNAGPAMSQVEKSLKRLEENTDKLSSSTSRLAKLTVGLTAAYAAFKGAMAALGGLDAINAAYDKQADAVRGLNKALELQGANVAEQSAKLQSFAGEMQKLTGVGDEATIAFMRQASMLGVGTDQLETVTKAAIGLSEVLGKDLESSLNDLRKAQEGNFTAFEKQFPQMKAMASEEEKLAFVTQMAAKGLEAKADASMTVSGMADRASGAIGDLMESVGALIAPVRILISQGIKTLAESLRQVLAPAVEYAQGILENIGPLMDWLKNKIVQAINGIIAAFTFVEVIVMNLDKVWAIMVATVELKFEQMKNIIMHVLTEVIPQYATWFGENFTNIMRDALSLAYTIISNHIKKYIDAFKAFWNFLATFGSSDILGELGEIAGRSYLDGFVASTEALPEIAARRISEREQELSDRIGMIGGQIGDEFSRKFAERMVKLDDEVGKDFDKEINLKVNRKIEEQVGGKLGGGGGSQDLQAKESRLLTRGPATERMDLLAAVQKLSNKVDQIEQNTAKSYSASNTANQALQAIQANTANTTQLVGVV